VVLEGCSSSFQNVVGMITTSFSSSQQCPEDTQIWEQLKQAIAASSGFQRWQLECSLEGHLQTQTLDSRVRSYLRETLETLSY
jgi:hypothetical protein